MSKIDMNTSRARDIEAALRFIEAEMIDQPMRMGSRGTGPAMIHYAVIRDVLRDALLAREEARRR